MAWTEERRQKALATRARNKQKRMEEESRVPSELDVAPPPNGKPVVQVSPLDWWETAPINEIISKLGAMKREFDRCAQIVLRRQRPEPKFLTCWTAQKERHPHYPAPLSVVQQCRVNIPAERVPFRDDGVYDIVDGIRLHNPAVCCGFLCHQFYQESKPVSALSRS